VSVSGAARSTVNDYRTSSIARGFSHSDPP
jgi:hypothetical protein